MILTVLVAVVENFKYALGILVKGMVGIFIFMGLFYALIIVLNSIFQQKEKH
ncbi:MAG: hypothetical protein WC179_02415 [Candidatus Cloacimonadaceae bacterium]|nr:hypothetical protein [Candidatus Cloacimonadota bacterium]MCB5258152.1 hypothetical protein [Candidatus Cloacimonadota bacterium]MDD5624222.1 hypothetical protein [Candidatus Cloacimonadota bacterium]MDY0112160.1 hypothetical protein [Candidatus Syntrophosphaera sp.]